MRPSRLWGYGNGDDNSGFARCSGPECNVAVAGAGRLVSGGDVADDDDNAIESCRLVRGKDPDVSR